MCFVAFCLSKCSKKSVAMECQNDGWIAFGFSNQNSGGMTNADMTIGRVVGTAMQVQDYWTGSQGTPNLDVTQVGHFVVIVGCFVGLMIFEEHHQHHWI